MRHLHQLTTISRPVFSQSRNRKNVRAGRQRWELWKADLGTRHCCCIHQLIAPVTPYMRPTWGQPCQTPEWIGEELQAPMPVRLAVGGCWGRRVTLCTRIFLSWTCNHTLKWKLSCKEQQGNPSVGSCHPCSGSRLISSPLLQSWVVLRTVWAVL